MDPATDWITGIGNCSSCPKEMSQTATVSVIPALTTHNETVCYGGSIVVNGTTYDASNTTGTEVFTNIGANNCDSTVTVNLTIENQIDNTVTTTDVSMTANQTGATYQWIDCNNGNTAISGVTNANYTATANGDYAAVITVGNCSDTSACVNINSVSISENSFGNDINLYPNPTNDNVTIELGNIQNVKITIVSVAGKEVVRFNNVTAKQVQISLADFSDGIYFVKITSDNQQKVVKLIKQ